MNVTTPFVYFDLGNVLLKFDHRRACRQLAACLNCDSDLIWDVVFAGGLEWAWERGELTRDAFLRELMRRCQVSQAVGDWEQAAADIFEPVPGAQAVVEAVRDAGIRMGLFSNTNDVHWEFVCRRYRWLRDAFDVYALSYELGALKPEPQAYAAAERLSGADTRSVFFVDDRPENVAAAKSHGWDAVLFVDPAQLQLELRRRGLTASCAPDNMGG